MIKRKKVGQIIFIGVLFTLSVGAIGFSSWNYGAGLSGANTGIEISFGDSIIYNTSDIARVESINRLGYSQYGFYNDNEVGSKTGNLQFTVVYNFDLIEINLSSLNVSYSFDYSNFSSNISNVSVYTNISNIYKTYSSSPYSIKNLTLSNENSVLDYGFEIDGISLDSTLGSGKRYISITNNILFNYTGIDFYNDVYTKVSSLSNFSVTLGITGYK